MMIPTLSSRSAEQQNNLFNIISRTSLLTGSLYIVATIIRFYFDTERGASLHLSTQNGRVSFITYIIEGGFASVFKFIASGAFGTEALSGGMLMVVWGLVFHFMIAFGFTVVLFLSHPLIIKKTKNKWLTGIIYGFFTWIIMTLGILPLSSIRSGPFDPLRAIFDIVLLVCTIGIPAALVAENFYKKRDDG